MADETKADRAIISENARSSVSQNVVNEFSILKARWETSLAEMYKNASAARESSQRAEIEAIKASEKARAIEKSAGTIQDMATMIFSINKSIGELESRLKQVDLTLRTMENENDLSILKNKSNYDTLSNLYRDLDAKIKILEGKK